MVARRAALEDDLAVLDQLESLGALDLFSVDDAQEFKRRIGRLASLATGRRTVVNEMQKLPGRGES